MSAADVRRAAEAIRAGSAARHLLLFSDFDGTLCEFRVDPQSVRLSDARRLLLESIGTSGNATVAIVSGRRLDDVRARADLTLPAYYAGLHGLEIAGPDGVFRHPDVDGTVALVHQLVRSLTAAVAGLHGVFIEDKELSLVTHYRDASPADAERAVDTVSRLVRSHIDAGRLRVMQGSGMLEFLPDIPWHKGSAVEWIIDKVSRRHHNPWPVYIGDDVTDQDAFGALRGRGLSIAAAPRATGAEISLDGPREVEDLLRSLTDVASG
ncbi:MAG TPA: trehalose-phosphatase [Vicinamibacterales bacterium]|jgi:trehalose-phosphatase|nr:trehalose-phosphatase [Vicinamibacterales bacterium]